MEILIHGRTIAYDDVGQAEAPCVLLIHGFPLDRRMWQEQVVGLSNVARLIVPDPRGHGHSEAAAGPATMEGHADDLAALLDHVGVERAIVAGLSMGGYVALAMWRRHPERVLGLVLLDTRAEADSPVARDNRAKGIVQAREGGSKAVAEEMLPKMLSPQNLANAGLRATVLDIMEGQTAEGTVAALQGLRDRSDNTPALATITVPTLVVVGEFDAITPPDISVGMTEKISGSELVVIPEAGHLSPLENPNAVNRALASFIARFGRGSGKVDHEVV